MEIIVTKASGIKEPFSEEKLKQSLAKAKASSAVINSTVSRISGGLRDGVPTAEIYANTLSVLDEQEPLTASRYSLRQAVMGLGPDGHIFEKFVGMLLSAEGFSVEVGKIVPGVCVSHEVDVVAEKDGRHIMVECKFHNQPGVKSDVKVALYVQARFEDIERSWKKQPGHAHKFHEAWLVTNTKLTSDAIQYAACVGMKAIGWNQPLGDSLHDLIERSGLHPLTCLRSLSEPQKRTLLNMGLVLCKEIAENGKLLRAAGLTEEVIGQVELEIGTLCGAPQAT